MRTGVSRTGVSRTGVFVGITTNDYAQLLRAQLGSDGDASSLPYFPLGNALNAAAGRISYAFGFRGPTMAIDTACSSSLVAVHNACTSLNAGECDMALAGGVNLILDDHVMRALTSAKMLSPAGRCRTFDDRADGYVRGEGCGTLVLKRLADAQRDGDRVLAVIAGSAVNQDGPGSGFAVPNGNAQREVIRQALSRAGLRGDQIDYVEAHGTGTPLGDPIEIAALADSLGAGRGADRPLQVGSLKTNVGHLESAAGIASLIKVVLALQHETIPRQIHLEQLNRRVDWSGIPVRVASAAMDWPRGDRGRAAGVSGFGISGTNAHLVLREAPAAVREPAVSEQDPRWQLLPCSAHGETLLLEHAESWAGLLEQEPPEAWPSLAAEAGQGRRHLAHRMAVVASSPQAAAAALRGSLEPAAAQRFVAQVTSSGPRTLTLAFVGELDMDSRQPERDWLELPAVRSTLVECATALGPADELGSGARAWERLQGAGVPHALLAVAAQLAEARLLGSWGLRPDRWRGVGAGGWVAAVLSETSTLTEAVRRLLEGDDVPSATAGGDGALVVSFPPAGDEGEGEHDDTIVFGAAPGGASTPTFGGHYVVARPAAGRRRSLETAAALYCAGHALDWRALYGSPPRAPRPLPSIPFQRRSYWLSEGWSPASRSEVTPVSKPLEPPQAPVAAPAVADPVATDPVGTDPGKILGELVDIFARILQEPREAIDTGAPLVELGADSIVLMEALRAIETNYEVRIPIQQLFEELSTLNAISRFLATESPVARPAEPAAAAAPNRVAPPADPNRVAPPAAPSLAVAPNRVAPLEAPPSAAPNRVAPPADPNRVAPVS
ncbi:MAG: beta-ketoacyl synthase N-terminal-like domain-containing protein, partial [Acidobacteriota bacterium]